MAEEHFDFGTKSSTNNAIYKLYNVTLNDSNRDLTVGGHFVNLKRFDCSQQKKVCSKLEFYGVKGKLGLWFDS